GLGVSGRLAINGAAADIVKRSAAVRPADARFGNSDRNGVQIAAFKFQYSYPNGVIKRLIAVARLVITLKNECQIAPVGRRLKKVRRSYSRLAENNLVNAGIEMSSTDN